MSLMTTKQAAELLSISHRTLESMRLKGGGPVYTKVGRLVRYPSAAIDEWLLLNQRTSTSQQSQQGASSRELEDTYKRGSFQ
jgi:excisionase family DNA binding protein